MSFLTKKTSEIRTYIGLTLIVILIGGVVFTAGFGICLYMSRSQVTELTNKGVMRDLDVIHNYVDGSLHGIEEVAYSLCWADNRQYAVFDPTDFESEEKMFRFLENVLIVHPNICGIAIGLEPSAYSKPQGQYGFAVYVTNVSGQNKRLRLGAVNNYREKEWYKKAASINKPYWSLPFRESAQGEVVTCFSLPLHDKAGNIVGVMAIDVYTEAFRLKCNDIMPFKHAKVTLVDREFRFISHPETKFLLQNVYTDDPEQWTGINKQQILTQKKGVIHVHKGKEKSLFYYDIIPRTGWIIGIECPESDVYSGVNTMRKNTTLIAFVSILVMIVVFLYLFKNLQKITVSKANIDKELKIAADIQMGMTPKSQSNISQHKNVDIYGLLHPTRDIGGDLYDYFFIDDILYFCIGDVSGKGVPASLFMSATHYLFRNATESHNKIDRAVATINHSLSTDNEKNMFVTFFCGKLDLTTGLLEFCNAGHNAPILITPKDEVKTQFIKTNKGLPLGAMDIDTYKLETIQLQDGDTLFLYTDGVTESMNERNEELGDQETLRCISKHTTDTVQEKVDALYNRIQQHAAGTEQSDDITMLCIRYQQHSTSSSAASHSRQFSSN